MGIYTLKIVGESYCQKSIKYCNPGDLLILKREPDNKHDENAVAVLRKNNEQIGYLSRKDAEWVARIIDNGNSVEARIKFVTGSGKDLLGVVIDLNTTPRWGWEEEKENNEKEFVVNSRENTTKSFWRKLFNK